MPETSTSTAVQTISQLAALPAVHRAFQWFHLQEPQLRRWHAELAAIPAPAFGEQARAEWLCDKFTALGLQDVHIDACGNALGWWRGTGVGPSAPHAHTTMPRPCILLSAHLDTVFSAEAMRTPVAQESFLFAPSVSDNTAGLTALLALAAALQSSTLASSSFSSTPLPTEMDILFAGNVGEEGEGNLRGMRHLFLHSPVRHQITAAVVLDGPGTESIVTQGLGSRRFCVTITGPGGHSWSDAGTPNPILVLSTALAELQKMKIPRSPRTSWNVGRIDGGTVVNAIPERAEARIDMRSTDAAQLHRMEMALHRAVEDAVHIGNSQASHPYAVPAPLSHPHTGDSHAPNTEASRLAFLSRPASPIRPAPLQYTIEMIGERPAARLPDSARTLSILRAVDRHLNIHSEARLASTDANIPLSLGIEAVSIGSGGSGGGMHTREEWFDATGRDLGLRRILLLLLAITQISS